jgi:hypothetical protein|tara:strand:- start:289 stop:462 length:174 start_codon:yes stop_codon:yes gene_type:complete
MDMIYEILNAIFAGIILVFSGWVAWDSSVMISEKKARYKAGTHDYYDNPIEDLNGED